MQRVRPSQTPPVPQRPSAEDLNNPIPHSLNKQLEPDNTQILGMKGIMQKVNPFSRSSAQSSKVTPEDPTERQVSDDKQNPGVFRGVMQKVNPFRSTSQAVSSDLSTSSDSLTDKNTQVEQGGKEQAEKPAVNKQNPGVFRGVMQKVNPFRSTSQAVSSDTSRDRLSDNNNSRVTQDREHVAIQTKSDQPTRKNKGVTFRIRRILPGALFGSAGKDSTVEIQDLEIAPLHSEGDVLDSEEEDTLMDWWRTVEGWSQWNETPEFQEDEELAVEQAADRVFLAARLFVRLFNERGGSLQQRVLELLALADAADHFHKRTVTASVGGGVASVAGSVTTITGLILAPFTLGTSLIVTAVGIGVATAGGITSASANITDTVHSNTDRKKVEAMIEGYEEEMRDIRECLEFVQEGMSALEQWNFEQYKETVSKRALNQNVRHVMKEGGRAGKALMINTESLVSTVQVLSVAGGAAKAAQAVSVATGVMSGLFLALDLFFLAKDSHELRKGAKTQFATKIRDVCKDLQDGLLELNRIKTDLQRTMDGIELEEEEEEPALPSDPINLIQLEG